MTTCRGKHSLIEIYSEGSDMERSVVRWCEKCGAVAVDIDVDTRTSPGAFMAMKLPQTELERQGQQ